MFLINLFIGVIFYNFCRAQKNSKLNFLTEKEENWIRTQKLISNYKFQIPLQFKYKEINFFQKLSHILVSSVYFRYFTDLMILLSSIFISMTYEGSSKSYNNFLICSDIFCIIFFTFESFLKIFAYGFLEFISIDLNKLDLAILISSYSNLAINYFLSNLFRNLSYGKTLIRVLITFKILRTLRLIRILKKNKDVNKLLKTLYFSLPMTLNILSLVLILMFIYTLFACKYFGNIQSNNIDHLDDYINFNNFNYAIMTLFKINTADEWELIMFDIMKINKYTCFYFISFYIIISFIMINLFILVLINQFEEYYGNTENPLNSFYDHLENFHKVWLKYCKKTDPLFIEENKLVQFLANLNPPLGKFILIDNFIFKALKKRKIQITSLYL